MSHDRSPSHCAWADFYYFSANDKENDRFGYDSLVSPRALREIYLMPFMLAQKHAKPWAYMTSYA